MRVGAVVHARMGSSRLPGKVLGDLAGRPALSWLLERLEHAQQLDVVVVATSDESADDPLEDYCVRGGHALHRGPLDDVASRVLGAAEAHHLDAVARVNGDSPMLDQRLVDQGVELLRASGADLVSNVRPRSFPPGQSVEVLCTTALRLAVERMIKAEDREHVTAWLYR
ncbi:MAG: NTP transferase domain-containing protein, partial [Solirubrobacteraceae bacterium]